MNNDIELFYTECGEGQVMLLLHGNGEDHRIFVFLIEHFSKRYKVFAIDSRGHGKTLNGTKPLTIETMAEDLEEFIEQHNLDNIILLGFSDGANIAMHVAMKLQSKIAKLILIGGNADYKGLKWWVRLSIRTTLFYTTILKFMPSMKRKKIYYEIMSKQQNITAKELSKITANTLIIAGSNDMVKEEHTRFIHNEIKNSTLQIIDGDHFVVINKPQIICNFADVFLDDFKRFSN